MIVSVIPVETRVEKLIHILYDREVYKKYIFLNQSAVYLKD